MHIYIKGFFIHVSSNTFEEGIFHPDMLKIELWVL